MCMERVKEAEPCALKAHSPEPSAAVAVTEGGHHRRAEKSGASSERGTSHETGPTKKRGRPRPRWRIRVVRVDAARHPEFESQRTNPFAAMAAEARIAEIDAFCARLWARTKKKVA